MLVLLLVACFIFCVFKKCFGKKKKPKKVRERKAGRRRKEKEGEGETGEKVSCYLRSYSIKTFMMSFQCKTLALIGGGGEKGRAAGGEGTGEVG